MAMDRFPTRKKIRLPLSVYDQGHAFFETIATYKKYPWFSVHPKLCAEAGKLLCDLASASNVTIYAWCLMPDHIHILLQRGNLINFIRMFKGKMTPRARKVMQYQKLWQRSFYDHALRKEESLTEVACYIWENPVRAEIVENPIEYPWSGSVV